MYNIFIAYCIVFIHEPDEIFVKMSFDTSTDSRIVFRLSTKLDHFHIWTIDKIKSMTNLNYCKNRSMMNSNF